MKFDPPDFEGSLNQIFTLIGFNPWKYSLSLKNILKGMPLWLLPLNSRTMLLFGLKTSKGKEIKKICLGLEHGPNSRN